MSILHICATFHIFNGELGDELEDFGCKFVNILSKFVFLTLLFRESLSHTWESTCVSYSLGQDEIH